MADAAGGLSVVYELLPDVENWIEDTRAAFAHITDKSCLAWGGIILFPAMSEAVWEEERELEEERKRQAEENARRIVEEEKRLADEEQQRLVDERAARIEALRTEANAAINAIVGQSIEGKFAATECSKRMEAINGDLARKIRELGTEGDEGEPELEEADVMDVDDAPAVVPPSPSLKTSGSRKRKFAEETTELVGGDKVRYSFQNFLSSSTDFFPL
jgi:hypothetical protein